MKTLYLILNVICFAIFVITVVPRLNDIGKNKRELVWHTRRLGLVMVGVGSVALAYLYFIPPNAEGDALRAYISQMKNLRFFDTILHIGFALTWITTPNHPPFWDYITRGNSPIPHDRRKTDGPQN